MYIQSCNGNSEYSDYKKDLQYILPRKFYLLTLFFDHNIKGTKLDNTIIDIFDENNDPLNKFYIFIIERCENILHISDLIKEGVIYLFNCFKKEKRNIYSIDENGKRLYDNRESETNNGTSISVNIPDRNNDVDNTCSSQSLSGITEPLLTDDKPELR